jgi:hypothetical protein
MDDCWTTSLIELVEITGLDKLDRRRGAVASAM